MPRIVKRLDLSGSVCAARMAEQDVVVGVRVERRVEVDEIDRLVLDVSSQHVEVVAVVEDFPWRVGHVAQAIGRDRRFSCSIHWLARVPH